ncbi:MAG: hypothetical protein EPO32_12245 [Anaerolineae bacterium]|nr:MAG: hypothetical protein EPO32_12245 [Anaerolineae bacterium]
MNRFVIVMLCAVLLVACGSADTPTVPADAPAFDVTGEWAYEMIAADGNVWDNGTITFKGSASSGAYNQINVYEIEYTGEYTAGGNALQLTGYLNWQGTFSDADTLSGTWVDDQNDQTGTFTATRNP